MDRLVQPGHDTLCVKELWSLVVVVLPCAVCICVCVHVCVSVCGHTKVSIYLN